MTNLDKLPPDELHLLAMMRANQVRTTLGKLILEGEPGEFDPIYELCMDALEEAEDAVSYLSSYIPGNSSYRGPEQLEAEETAP